MSLFSKLFNPYSQTEEDKIEETCTLSISDVGILEETVRELILDSVVPFTGNDYFIGVTIWIDDEFFHIAGKESFVTSLRASFDSMKLLSLGKGDIKVIHGKPTDEDDASPLVKKDILPPGKMWIKLLQKGMAEKTSMAKISVFHGRGSCEKDEYILDAYEKQVFKIGRGPVCRKPEEPFRVNDIVIEENNPDQTVQKLNNFVSGSQANIIYEDGVFFLKAMPSGSRINGGSPTKIIREDNAIELRDHISTYILHDGDYIELGKSVLLFFQIIKNS